MDDDRLCCQRAEFLGDGPVHPEGPLHVDFAVAAAALDEQVGHGDRTVARGDARPGEADRTHPRKSGDACPPRPPGEPRDDRLGDYRAKRDLRRSPEPAGEPRPRRSDGEPIFVVQRHLARTEHYDLRLEVDGVLKSWAVPKGPSTDPREKRLAVRVEDHPLEYADFEGLIPKGEYGAGAVIVWDRGTYRNRTKRDGAEVPIQRALEQGHVVVELHGQKLRGAYALTRTGTDRRGRERWLLVKKRDEYAAAAPDVLSAQPESVLSGRTLEQVAAGDE
jgi:DNA ligase D-like protein (predicted 3'-phosphoesterase)